MKLKLPKITKQKLLSKRFILGVIIVDSLLILSIIGAYSLANRAVNTVVSDGDLSKITECFPLSDLERQRCLDKFIEEYANTTQKNTKSILADLEAIRSESPTMEAECHVVSHSIGRYTYSKYPNVGEAFEACDLTCNSGCYHGIMERMFFNDEDLEEGTQHLSYEQMAGKAPHICDRERFDNPSNFVIFQCYHGLGHALNYFSRYDLDQALKVCDLVESDYDKYSCYGGVFMENVTAFEKGKRDLKLGDPHYPCNRVADKYKSECYGMQTSVMLEYGLTNKQMADECRKAGDNTWRCFESYGRDLSNLARADRMPELVLACEVYANGYEENCIRTAAYVLIDSTSDGRYAYAFCDALTQASNQNICYASTSRYLENSFLRTPQEILQDCREHSVNDARCESSQ